MAINKEKTYLVLNYCANPVSVATRYDSYMLEACKEGKPTSIPLTLDEIHQVNNTSKAFKTGYLKFEPEFEEELYEALRIYKWKDILNTEQIEDIIINPTTDKLESVLKIEEPRYFNRIYGIYVGMKNAGYSISKNVDIVMTTRYKELVNHKRKTGLVLTKKEEKTDADMTLLKEENKTIKEQNQNMQTQLLEMQKMMEDIKKMMSASKTSEKVESEKEINTTPDAPQEKSEEKKVIKPATKNTTTSKTVKSNT